MEYRRVKFSDTDCLAPFAESAHLLGRLIHACPRLVLPYVSAILKALVAKLRTVPSLQITATGPPGTAAKASLVQGGPARCC